jgi:hypothetical protein
LAQAFRLGGDRNYGMPREGPSTEMGYRIGFGIGLASQVDELEMCQNSPARLTGAWISDPNSDVNWFERSLRVSAIGQS